jgi:NitT/TauT family transport system substrate-binding protein
VEILGRYDKDSSADILRRELAATRNLVRPDQSVPIGHIDTAAWKQTEDIMLAQGLVPAPVHVEKALRQIAPQ